MPPKKLEVEKDDWNRYLTKGLTEKQFTVQMNRIQKEQIKKRQNAKRTLTPGALSRRSTADLVKLGNKQNGQPFTVADLKRFDQMRKRFKKRRGTTPGILYREIIGRGRQIDIKRANNQSGDGLGITNARLIALRQGSTAIVRVKASQKSVHQEHQVKIRLEEWEDELANADGDTQSYIKAVKSAAKGRLSFDCDCGRHQYWYRYMATIGNYQIKPPSELSFPKIRNSNLTGVACKHVTKAVGMLQSQTWIRPLAVRMEKQANTIGFTDSKRKTDFLSKEELKKAKTNRKLTANQKKAREEYRKYVQRNAKAAKKLKSDQDKIARLQAKLKRKQSKEKEQAKEIEKLKKERDALREMTKDKVKMQLSAFVDGAKLAGLSKADALSAYSNKTKIPIDMLKGLL